MERKRIERVREGGGRQKKKGSEREYRLVCTYLYSGAYRLVKGVQNHESDHSAHKSDIFQI